MCCCERPVRRKLNWFDAQNSQQLHVTAKLQLTVPSCTTALGALFQPPSPSAPLPMSSTSALGSFSSPPYRLMNSVGCRRSALPWARCFLRSPSLGVRMGVPRTSDAVFFALELEFVRRAAGLQKERRPVQVQSSSSESRRSRLAYTSRRELPLLPLVA